MFRLKTFAVVCLGLLAFAGCAPQEEAAPEPEPTPEPTAEVMPAPMTAVADLSTRGDWTVAGSVHFEQAAAGDPVTITAGITGAPAGSHGFHIHEVGDCSADDFTSSGGHFNPTGVPHGGPDDAERHAGDLGNIVIGEDGTGSLELSSSLITLVEGEANSVLGRAVILHEGEDDLVSQPTGAAGARIACGVIGAG